MADPGVPYFELLRQCDSPLVVHELQLLIGKLMKVTGEPIERFLPYDKEDGAARAWFGNVATRITEADTPEEKVRKRRLLEEVLEEGNARELSAMITNFIEGNCASMWKAFKRPATGVVDASFVALRRREIEEFFGVPFDALVRMKAGDERLLTEIDKEWPSVCHVSCTRPPHRITAAEGARAFRPDFRVHRPGASGTIHKASIYPPLSPREKSFLHDGSDLHTDLLPHVSAAKDRFQLEVQYTPFLQYNRAKGFDVAAGPSANTRMMLDCAALMGCDLDRILLACVLSLGAGVQHTPVEIAIETRNPRLQGRLTHVYEIGEDPVEYLERVAARVRAHPARRGRRGSSRGGGGRRGDSRRGRRGSSRRGGRR